MRLQVLGSGDAFGSGGRFNTCFLASATAGTFLIDCGASALIAMRRFGVDPNSIGTVFLSHLHGDHFGGLPFLLLDAQFYSKRTAPLTIAGPDGTEERLKQALEVFFPGSSAVQRKFATDFATLRPGEPLSVNGVRATPFEVNHACGAMPLALRLECDGRTIAYTGDTEWTDALIQAGRGADLLIAEALFFERKVKFHLDYMSLKRRLPAIGARRVLLTHLGPDMLSRRHEAPEEVAEDGMLIEL